MKSKAIVTIIFFVMITSTFLTLVKIDFSSAHNSSLTSPEIESKFPTNFFNIESIENETLLVHNMEVNVRLDGSLKVISSFVLANNGSEPIEFFSYQILENITSVYSFDPIDSLPFSWYIDPVLGNIINVTMRYPLLQEEIYVFSISYEINDVIYQIFEPTEYFGLDYEVLHVRNSKAFNLEIKLPVYSRLLETVQPAPVYPSPTRITFEDKGVRILWKIVDINAGGSDVFLVRYIIDSNEIVNPPNLLALYIVLAFLGGIGLSALTFYLLYRYKFKPVESGLVSSLLSDTEQEVIKAINIDGGVSTQRRICEKTGYSKSKVSQILAKLEEKEVLKRERWGRTNKVTITNPSFKSVGHQPPQTNTP